MIVIVMIVLLSNQQEKCSKVVCREWFTLKWSSLLAKLIWLTVPRGKGGGGEGGGASLDLPKKNMKKKLLRPRNSDADGDCKLIFYLKGPNWS